MTRPPLPHFLRRSYHRARHRVKGRLDLQVHRGPGYVEYAGARVALIRSEREPDRRFGIYLRGACDLPGLFLSVPMLRDEVRGMFCMYRAPGTIESGRADLLLQTLRDIPRSHTDEAERRLRLAASYFRPVLFEPTFTIPEIPKAGTFKKDIVVLSIAPNVIRTLYRHKEHGFLVDPGGSWLNNKIDVALADRATIAWFAANFEKAGRLSVDEFHEAFGQVVKELKARTGATIVVTNVLTVEPADRTHNFQLRPHPEGLRRRQFNLALVDMSRELDLHILDIDRALKGDGVDPSLDFAHFGGHSYDAVARATYRLLQDIDAL